MHAAYRGHIEVTKFLIDADADVDAKSNVSKTISIFAYVCVRVCVDKDIFPSYCMI